MFPFVYRPRVHLRSSRPEFITEFRSESDGIHKVSGWVDESTADRRAEPSHKASRSGPYLSI